MAAGIEALPALDAFFICNGHPLVHQDGTAGHYLPSGFRAGPGGIGPDGVDGDFVRVYQNGAVGAEEFPFGGVSRPEAVVLDAGDGQQLPHVKIAAVDAGQRPVLEAEGAYTVGLGAFRRHHLQAEVAFLEAHETHGLGGIEKLSLQCAIDGLGLGGLLPGERCSGAQVKEPGFRREGIGGRCAAKRQKRERHEDDFFHKRGFDAKVRIIWGKAADIREFENKFGNPEKEPYLCIPKPRSRAVGSSSGS